MTELYFNSKNSLSLGFLTSVYTLQLSNSATPPTFQNMDQPTIEPQTWCFLS